MTLTLLLDLDDTLLINNIERFIPAYMQSLSWYLQELVDPGLLVKELLSATRRMIQNDRPDCTLQEIFEETFYPAIGVEPEELQQPIAQFYGTIFPTLRHLTQPQPGAIKLVEEAFERGYRVGIATNPLFPLTAIQQRLEWAGLSPAKYPFEAIASFENYHFAKPNPALFMEMLARMGWPEGPIVMIGDSRGNDILPALQAGLKAYWINPNGKTKIESPGQYFSGSISGALAWLNQIDQEHRQLEFTSISGNLAILKATPAFIDYLSRQTDQLDTWTIRPQEDEWCQTEIFCHLRDVEEEVNLPRITKMLAENNPFLPGKDTDQWAAERQYLCQDGQAATHRFITARIKLIEKLKALPEEAWNRPARHSIFGPTSLIELVRIIAGHDRLHIHQIYTTRNTVLTTAK